MVWYPFWNIFRKMKHYYFMMNHSENIEEISANGYEVIKGKRLKDFLNCVLDQDVPDINVGNILIQDTIQKIFQSFSFNDFVSIRRNFLNILTMVHHKIIVFHFPENISKRIPNHCFQNNFPKPDKLWTPKYFLSTSGNLWDLGTGISIETKRFNYKLGINSFYYPRYFSGIKTDLELVVTYKF